MLPSDVVLLAPPSPPLPGQVVVAYEVLPSESGACSCDLNFVGILTMVVLLLTFAPLAWLPCVLQECQRKYARPVFGYPPPPGAVVVPVPVGGAAGAGPPPHAQQPHPQQPQHPQQQQAPYVPMTTAHVGGGAGPSSGPAPPPPAKEV